MLTSWSSVAALRARAALVVSPVMLWILGVIFGWHHPAAAYLAVVHKSLSITTILMVATNREPVEHQVGMRINIFVIGKPQRVLCRSHAIEMVDVAHGK